MFGFYEGCLGPSLSEERVIGVESDFSFISGSMLQPVNQLAEPVTSEGPHCLSGPLLASYSWAPCSSLIVVPPHWHVSVKHTQMATGWRAQLWTISNQSHISLLMKCFLSGSCRLDAFVMSAVGLPLVFLLAALGKDLWCRFSHTSLRCWMQGKPSRS